MADTAAGPPSEPTGVPGLDSVLGGGLPRRGIAFVVGAPGTGKTVLVNQLAFASARAGRPVLYFSGLSEPHERLIEHLRPFNFFDEGMLGADVQLLSLHSLLEQGAEDALAAIVRTVRRARAGLIIVDGLRGVRYLLAEHGTAHGFLYRLGTQLSLLGALLLVTLEAEPPASEAYPELSGGDVLFGLFYDRARAGHRRYLEVYKRRGAEHLPGLHALTIDVRGLSCYPQLEMTVRSLDPPVDPGARASFGLPALDEMVGGGLTVGTTTIVAGTVGSGKTVLGLQFLAEGVARGEPGLHLTFRESRQQLLTRGPRHGVDFAEAVERGAIRLLTPQTVLPDPDVLAEDLRAAVAESGARRLVVDSLAELMVAAGRERVYGYLMALAAVLRDRGVTTMLIMETSDVLGADISFSELPLSVVGDNVLLLRHFESGAEMRRVLTVIKMRFSGHDETVRAFTIGADGVRVLGRSDRPVSAPSNLIERGSVDPSSDADTAPRSAF